MHMMTHAEAQGAMDPNFCVAWTHGGSAFVVQDPDAFTKDVVPRFFKATKFASFTRKLYRWGFRQINRGSTNPTDPMIFSNESFHRDHKYLMANMRSTTNKKQKLNNVNAPSANLCNANNAIALPHGHGIGLNNFSALPQMDRSDMAGMPGMVGMASMGMTFPSGMAMGLIPNNVAMILPATVTTGANNPDGGAVMPAGTATITYNSGVAIGTGLKRKAQDDILESLDPTMAPGWNQRSSEERIRILQQALDASATHLAGAQSEQQAEGSFNGAAATAAPVPSTTPPTAPGTSFPNLDQLQHLQQQQQQLMLSQVQPDAIQSSSYQQNFSRTTLAERLRMTQQKYSMPLQQDVASQQQNASREANDTSADLGLPGPPNMSMKTNTSMKTNLMGSLANNDLNSMLAQNTGMMLSANLQQQQLEQRQQLEQQQFAAQQQSGGFGNTQ